METKLSSSISKIGPQSKILIPSGNPNSLPDEIITEILTRLPVKSLLKFRCVSKSWLSLISSPQFIKAHFQISSSNFMCLRIMLTFCLRGFNLKHCSAHSLIREPLTESLDLDYPEKHPNRAVWVVGSCNGLVCIAINENDLFIWNPCTGKSHQLPPVNVKMKPGFYNIYGFGYDESNGDYKVLGIFCWFGNSGVYESVVKMYSLRSNSWKRIEGFSAGLPMDDTCKFLAGKIHLAACPALGFKFRWDIVSFDLETEVYGLVERPDYGEGVVESSLGVLEKCLCVLCSKKTHADVWVMKDYGVKESWSIMITVPYFNDLRKDVYSKPLALLPSGEILLVFQSSFVVYNPENNCLRRLKTSNIGEFLEADGYVESLVSPDVV